MARTDAIVLGAGIVGVSAALHLAKRGLAVALVDRRAPGEETSYGNAGIIEGNTYFPYPFPRKISALLKIAFKQAPEANYHLFYLPRLAPWLFAYLRHSSGDAMFEFAERMRPLFAASIAEHESLMREANAERYLRTNGWLKIYRTSRAFDAAKPDLDAIAAAGLAFEPLDLGGSLALEPGLSPVFERGIFWPQAASVSN
ncbi:MAG: NAD(P)/FAD-dependent oxidoreductase, partial [Pseudorhodoplanes sp.]